MSNIAYIRVSTIEQNTDRQTFPNIEIDKVFEEKASASNIKRPKLDECINYLREGDILHIHSLDRVCRSGAGDAVKLVEHLSSKGVGIQFHKEGMSFYGSMTAAQKGVLSILASVAEMERGLIRERQAEGIAAAKAKGKHMGRPSIKVSKEQIEELLAQGLTVKAVAEQLKIGTSTVYKIKANT
ncbi:MULTISPECIES: recombinase family protein [unclassified Shewanella]|uniref:recombinase family protein n=1 Tax=unclassified Shewanella TaxID=196818 RepID=UPI00354B0CC2